MQELRESRTATESLVWTRFLSRGSEASGLRMNLLQEELYESPKKPGMLLGNLKTYRACHCRGSCSLVQLPVHQATSANLRTHDSIPETLIPEGNKSRVSGDGLESNS